MRFDIETLLRVVGVLLVAAAGYFYWTGNREGTFVAGVIGICAFFIAYRFRLRSMIAEHEAESEPESSPNSDN